MAAKATRQSFGEAVVKAGEKNPRVVVMDADLGKSTMTAEFMKKFPERYFEMGIAEHNLIGTAAGLAIGGKIPFITSFACFLAGRYETIRMSISYSNANVKMIGTHAGVGIGEDGNSQMGLEDIALLRSLPNMTLLQPADDTEAQQAVHWATDHKGPVYFRLTRQKLPDVHTEDYKFEFGKGDILKSAPTPKLVIFATGGVVANSLKAAEELGKEGSACTVVNIHTLKPFDDELAVKLARQCNKIFTVEDHYVVGGLGSAVSEAITNAGLPVKVYRHGMKAYGESGSPEDLYEKFGLSVSGIKKAASDFLKN